MELWDFKNGERNKILLWTLELNSRDRAALNQKLDMLQRIEFDQARNLKLLNGLHRVGHILKLRVMAQTALRPLLCRGPQAPLREYTLLEGASEKNSELHPAGAVETAIKNFDHVKNDETKRIRHERV